jgi:hypothetical protein
LAGIALTTTAPACEQVVGADFTNRARRPDAAAGGGASGTGGAGNGGTQTAGTGGNAATSAGGTTGATDAGNDSADGASAMGGGAGSAGNDAGEAGLDSNGSESGPPDGGARKRQRVEPPLATGTRRFGRSIALKGAWALVGAYEEDGRGSAWLLERQTNGEWLPKQKLLEPDNSQFGSVVSLADRHALVGATGEAHFFERSQSGDWSQAKRVEGGSFVFGIVSLVVGATSAAVGATDESDIRGSVYVYRHQGSWESWEKLSDPNGQPHDAFGVKLALDGDTLVVCSHFAGDENNTSGAAYVYEASGDSWVLRDKLLPTEASIRSFNYPSLQGDTLTIGAFLPQGGRAYVYTREPGGSFATGLPQLITPPDSLTEPQGFGVSSAICGDTLLIGHEGQHGTLSDHGDVFVYRRQARAWSLSSQLEPELIADTGFGKNVVCDGTTALVNAPDEDDGDDDGHGVVYFYDLTP